MLWKGHRAVAKLSCIGVLPNFEKYEQLLEKYSTYPDWHQVWKKCHEKYKKPAWIDEECPPPPPVHHDKLWGKTAVEFYLYRARKAWVSGERDKAIKLFAIFTHFFADLIIEPYEVSLLPDGKKWDYHETADPLSEVASEFTSPVSPEPWRPCLSCVKLFPEDWAIDLAFEIRSFVQRNRDRIDVIAKEAVRRLLGGTRSACIAVVEGWFTKEQFKKYEKIGLLIPTLYLVLQNRKAWQKHRKGP